MNPKNSKNPKGSPSINNKTLLSDSVNSCIESNIGYSHSSVPHQTCLSLQKYNGKIESLIIF